MKYLEEHYPDGDVKGIAEYLGRSVQAVYYQAHIQALKRKRMNQETP